MNDYDLETLLPHSGKMALLDHVTAYSEEGLEASVIVRHDGLFSITDGAVPAFVSIEYMAQAVAAFAGIRGRADSGHVRPGLGLLLGVRGYSSSVECFFPGQELSITVKPVVEGAKGFGVFDCRLTGDDARVHARLTVLAVDSLADL